MAVKCGEVLRPLFESVSDVTVEKKHALERFVGKLTAAVTV
jgi:hypothetical protein